MYLPTGRTEVLYKLDLSAEEQEVLTHVNGRSTVEQICNVSYLSNFETCRILWALQVLGIVEAGAGRRGDGRRAKARASTSARSTSKGSSRPSTRCSAASTASCAGGSASGVDEFMDAAMEEVNAPVRRAVRRASTCKQYGRADFEQMLANVADLPADQRKAVMVSALNELMYVMQLQVRTRYGKQEEAVVIRPHQGRAAAAAAAR